MKKNFKNIIAYSLLSLALLSGCKEDDLVPNTTLHTDRVFSATGLTAVVINKVNVRLTWLKVTGASTYTIEVYDNATLAGTPVKTIPNVLFSQLPYTVTGLEGNLQHSVRVKSISSEGVADSKWVSVAFKTDPEQILNAVNLGDITSNSTKITWPANEAVTKIVFNPGNITYTLTPADIVAGSATVSGLAAETLYTAVIFNNNIQRGSANFTTGVDVSAFTQVHNDTEFATALAGTGAVRIALHPGNYTFTGDININNNTTIVGVNQGNKPVIRGAVFRVKALASLSLKYLEIDGTGALNGNQMIIYDEASDNTYGNLSVESNVVRNYVKGLVYINVKALVEAMSFKGNLISNIECNGGDFIDFRTGFAKSLNFSNNTVYNSAVARDLFRMDPTGSTNFSAFTSVITIANNTLNGVSNGAANRILYVRLAKHEIYFTKNIVANSGGILSNQAATNIVGANFVANNYFNAPTYISGSATANAKYDTGSSTTLNPGFTNVATGNFTISNIDLKTNGIGDPRWRL